MYSCTMIIEFGSEISSAQGHSGHLADGQLSFLQARACIMGIGPGQKSEGKKDTFQILNRTYILDNFL
jgi:hypothetical protein